MNRRINKKINKRNGSLICVFDLNEPALPILRSYREIKTHRKINHEYLIRRTRLDFNLDKWLRLKRTMHRKDYFKAMRNRFKEEI
jgi:hypothetical protein